MTLPKLLFALGQKGVVLSEGKAGRIRFNPRRPVSPALKAAVAEHKPALLALLRGDELEDWRHVRLRKLDDAEDAGGGLHLAGDDPFTEEHVALAERWAMEDAWC